MPLRWLSDYLYFCNKTLGPELAHTQGHSVASIHALLLADANFFIERSRLREP
jgi:hypothetical protein